MSSSSQNNPWKPQERESKLSWPNQVSIQAPFLVIFIFLKPRQLNLSIWGINLKSYQSIEIMSWMNMLKIRNLWQKMKGC